MQMIFQSKKNPDTVLKINVTKIPGKGKFVYAEYEEANFKPRTYLYRVPEDCDKPARQLCGFGLLSVMASLGLRYKWSIASIAD